MNYKTIEKEINDKRVKSGKANGKRNWENEYKITLKRRNTKETGFMKKPKK